jgi:hypothetical protein
VSSRVPVLVLIDVEPEGFFVDRTARDPWSGFERAVPFMTELRASCVRETGSDAHFTWLVRSDAQIADTYGSAAWGLRHYRDAVATLLAAGDEVGAHVHAYRWDERARHWVEDYGDQGWIEHCVRLGVDAFEQHFGRRPASFSMGMDWTNQATVDLLREVGIRFELSTILGKEPQRFPPRDSYTGVAPDCSRMPRRPYQPADGAFLVPAPPRRDGLWIVPQSSRVTRVWPSWKRTVWHLARLEAPAPRWTRKLFLQDADLDAAVDEAMRSVECPYLTFAVRTHEFSDVEATAIVRRNLEAVLRRPDARRFVFATPRRRPRRSRSWATSTPRPPDRVVHPPRRRRHASRPWCRIRCWRWNRAAAARPWCFWKYHPRLSPRMRPMSVLSALLAPPR